MPSINNITVVDRHNRPQVDQKVLIRTYFVNDGQYVDPYAVSSVHIFDRAYNLSPSTVLNSSGTVASSTTDLAKMVFAPSGTGVVATDATFGTPVSSYTGVIPAGADADDACSGVSGVYRMGLGEFACVLDGGAGSNLSGTDHNGDRIQNTTSAAGRYVDVWTVKMFSDSDWTTYINSFELFDNTVLSLTEPLLLRAKNKLFNKRVTLGSKVDLKIGTEITVENENIDENVKNIFKQSVITSATVVIKKHNEDANLPSRVTVVSATDVATTRPTQLTSDNTIIYSFDTTADLTSGNPTSLDVSELGSKTGTYSLQVEYNLLSEKIVSPMMYFIVK